MLFAIAIPKNGHAQETDAPVDTLKAIPDSALVGTKLFYPGKQNKTASLSNQKKGNIYLLLENQIRTTIKWDSADTFKIEKSLFGYSTFIPSVLDRESYIALKREEQKRSIRTELIEEGKAQQEQGRGLLDFKIKVPGGERSAFTTIFGKPEVNLRVNGTANMNVGASIQNVEDTNRPPDQWRRVDPTFNQNLQLNIQGTIGDKLTIATDWDTERQFDFQNRLKIRYEGYEDEIIKSIEMGNVSMETGNSLVRGGGALFGIKAVSELGPLKLTSVVSQQNGQSNSQTISGGSQELFFELRPADYDDDQHFFVDFYNRQEFEGNLSNPTLPGIAYQIEEIRVWIEDTQISTESDAVQALAMLDLGVVDNGDSTYSLPNTEFDGIDDAKLAELRSENNIDVEELQLPSGIYQNSYYRLLDPDQYTIDKNLGIISLNRRVGNQSSLAVSFTYRTSDGQQVQVGDINANSGGYTYLKLLRPRDLDPARIDWLLTLRNIYTLGVSAVEQDGFNFEIEVTRDNISRTRIEGRGPTLLQDLGLDRLNSNGSIGSDNIIDFDQSAMVFNPNTGKIMFPYLEPFGDRIDSLISDLPTDQSTLIFSELYDDKVIETQQNSKNNFFKINGSSKGGVSSTFFLGELVEGSVKVFANGVELTEGSDYEVDYSFGMLSILNDRYIARGQDLRIEYENNQFIAIGQKNFTGVRAEYTVNRDISIGSTYFRLNEQPLSDKIRIGNEPINNTVLGFDANARFDTPWLTRAIDKIPLLQTKEASNISFSGEFAQLRPGVAQTNAVRDAIDNNELFSDEEQGLVFIDDFEGSEYTIPFDFASRWFLPSPPAAVPGYAPDEPHFQSDGGDPSSATTDKVARADLRAQFSWYEVPRNIENILGNVVRTDEASIVRLTDVFRGRQTIEQDNRIIPLDVYYNPLERGPYNYNMDLKEVLENTPEKMWGGMTAPLPPGQQDLVQNNIEFLEFWVQSILPDGQSPEGLEEDYAGKIYIDLGVISEDVIPNGSQNSEDGLARDLESLELDLIDRSYIPADPVAPLGEFSNVNRDFEDVGFDGVPSTNGFQPNLTETALFSEFIEKMRTDYGEESEEFQKIVADPSNDDYVFYGESKVDGLKLHERFHRLRGYYEGNTPVAGGNDKLAVTLKPDNEALITPSSIQPNNAYYQYEINYNPAKPSDLEIGSPGTFIIDKVDRGSQTTTWRLIRIPITEFTRQVGNINGFRNITHMRVWMSGYKKPFTLRFATLEFLGSQWRKVEEITEARTSNAEFKISTINIEENASREPIPYRQPEGSIRAINRGAQIQSLANEQSLVLDVEDLGAGEIQMVKRVYPNGLNFLNYSNVRMFVHGEGFDERGEAELVVRFGSDLENDFYEYRQPVTPSDPDYPYGAFDPNERGRLNEDAAQVWLYEENSLNIVISAFNVLKQARDRAGEDPGVLFERSGLLSEEGAPGAVLAMRGNPSLDRITELAIGVKNPYEQGVSDVGGPIINAQFWVNELRVSGFDNENGWAANAKASFKLADFATVNTNLTRQTTGFGGIESRLGERSMSDDLGYSVSSTVNLHKLVPDRYGWSFPVTVSTRKTTSTPRFLPDQGDIRLDDFIDAVNIDETLTEAEKERTIDQKISDIQTITENYSLNISNISKRNSKSKLAEYTLDNTRLSYVYNQGYARNPRLDFQNNWNYTAGISYNLSFKNVKLFRPFKFTESVPGLNLLSGLRLGYMPTSISANASLARNYRESRQALLGSDEILPLEQSHLLTQKSSFGINYNLTPSITTSFRSNTSFDLTQAGQKPLGTTGVDSLAYDVVPTFEVLDGVLFDTLTARRSSYSETFSASWRPRLNRIKSLDWMTYSASYGGGFQWINSGEGTGLGARVSNSFQLDNSFKFDTDKLIKKIGFVEKLRKKDADEERARTQRKRNAERDTTRTPPDLIGGAQFYGRKVLLGLFSMRSIDLSYKKNKSSGQAGYDGEAPIYYAFNDPGSQRISPNIGYRMGLTERISRDQLIGSNNTNQAIGLGINNSYSDNITWGTQLNLFKNVTIDLDWSTRWDERRTENLTLTVDDEFTSIATASGDISSSIWSFGNGYEQFFKSQLSAAFADLDGTTINDETGNNDGKTVLGRVGLQQDFRTSYLGGNANAIGRKGFTPIPKPSWRVTWQGIEKLIPFIGDKISRASLTHGYRGSYRLGWQLNTQAGTEISQTVGSFTVISTPDEFEPSTISIDQRFSPLVQLNLTWKSNLRTNLGYETSTITSLTMSSNTVSERKSRGFKFNINYTFRKVRIPIFPKLKNNIDFALSGTFSEDSDQNFVLPNDLNRALKEVGEKGTDVDQYDFIPTQETGQQRFNGSLVIGYRISANMNSNFEYTYNRVIPTNGSTIPPRTNQEIRFNIRIAIRSR